MSNVSYNDPSSINPNMDSIGSFATPAGLGPIQEKTSGGSLDFQTLVEDKVSSMLQTGDKAFASLLNSVFDASSMVPQLEMPKATDKDIAEGGVMMERFSTLLQKNTTTEETNQSKTKVTFNDDLNLNAASNKEKDLSAILEMFTKLCSEIMSGGQVNTQAEITNSKAQIDAISTQSGIMSKLSMEVSQSMEKNTIAQVDIQKQQAEAAKKRSLLGKIGSFFKNVAIAFAGAVASAAISLATGAWTGVAGALIQFGAATAVLATTTFVNFDAMAAKKYPYPENATPEQKAEVDADRQKYLMGVKFALMAVTIAAAAVSIGLSAGTASGSSVMIGLVVTACVVASFASSMMQTGFVQSAIAADVANKQKGWIKEERKKDPDISDAELQKIIDQKSNEYQQTAGIACMAVLTVVSLAGGLSSVKLAGANASKAVSEAAQDAAEAGKKAADAALDSTELAAKAVKNATAANATASKTSENITRGIRAADASFDAANSVAEGITTAVLAKQQSDAQKEINEAKGEAIDQEALVNAKQTLLALLKQIIQTLQEQMTPQVQEGASEVSKVLGEVQELVNSVRQTKQQGAILEPTRG